MAYVRWLISERRKLDVVIRRYEVETPRWYLERPSYELDVTFPPLVELELRISGECADYFHKVPYSLAEAIWVQGLRSAWFVPFCCTEYHVLFYRRQPEVQMITNLAYCHTRPVALSVTLGPDPRLPRRSASDQLR